MLGRVKKWLGIEGIKVEILKESIHVQDQNLKGRLRFTSMRPQTINGITIRLIERYERGRGSNKLKDEYLLAEEKVHKLLEVEPDHAVEVEFSIDFETMESEMDKMEKRNFLFRGLIKAAKVIKRVSSSYRIEVTADVIGTALNPFDQVEVKV